jgi:hypothetical protein
MRNLQSHLQQIKTKNFQGEIENLRREIEDMNKKMRPLEPKTMVLK